MIGYVRLELSRLARTPGLLIFAVLVPMMSYLVFTNLGSISGQNKADAAVYTMISMAGYGAIGALLNYAADVVNDRKIGWLRQLRLTPLPPVTVVLAKAVAGMTVALVPVLALIGVAVTVNGVRLSAGAWAAIIPMLWLGAAPFVLLGLSLGYLATQQTVQPLFFLSYFGLSILGGLWLPLAVMPSAIARIGEYLPTHAYANLSWAVAFGLRPSVHDAVILLAWGLAFTVLASLGYRRSVRRLG